MTDSDREAIIERLRLEVEQARLVYEEAIQSAKLLREFSTDAPRPDGGLILFKAHSMETQGRRLYQEKLHQFNQYLLTGVLPATMKASEGNQ